MKRNGFTSVELMIVVAIVGIFLSIAFPNFRFMTILPHYSSGTRTGVVVKISQRGFHWKTWEAEMNVGGMSSDGNGMAVPVVWKFSVKDQSVIDAILRASEKGSRVTVKYDQAFIRKFTEGATEYLATGVVE